MANSKDSEINRLRKLQRYYLRVAARAKERRARKVENRYERKSQGVTIAVRKRRRELLIPPIKSGVTTRDGEEVAAWIAPFIDHARAHGWQGRVNDGTRSLANAWYLWNNSARLGLIHYVSVAFPGSSNHIGYVWPKGAIDVSDAETFARLEHGRTINGRTLRAYKRVVGPRDDPHFSATGH